MLRRRWTDEQRKAIWAAKAEARSKRTRRSIGKRLLIGGALTAAGAGLAYAGRRNPLVRTLAISPLRTGLLGLGATIGTAATTLREAANRRLEEGRRYARVPGAYIAKKAEHGKTMIRTFPVELLAAKGVDKGFGLLESGIHSHLSGRIQRLEEIAGHKLGAAQGIVSAAAEKRARDLHRRHFPQPFGPADERRMATWGARLNHTSNVAELAKPRPLRRGQDWRVAAAKQQLWQRLSQRGLLLQAARGLIDPQTLEAVAAEQGIKDRRRMMQVATALQDDLIFGTGR